METKEIIISNIIAILSKKGFIKESNSELKARLKCVGIGEYFNEYSEYLQPYYYNGSYENLNNQYDIFLGLDYIFTDLYKQNKIDMIIIFLKELTKSFNTWYIKEKYESVFEELKKLYSLLGLEININGEEVIVTVFTTINDIRLKDLFSTESWLKKEHPEVYESYDSAISSYTNGKVGICIEACRTTIVSLFSKYKGTDSFAKWIRGVFEESGDSNNLSIEEMGKNIKNFNKEELFKFFNENKNGKMKKTKTIYMIYSMMSDYGTHRNEGTVETPSISDAFFMLRLTDSILFWIYSIQLQKNIQN